ncbi:P-loop containing nucleoside triphosphate hydrolase protein [Amniculicola lignicola CBS 123094]|uniref:P-loop containing nucleoside triphosphate hydrolase protein n=1 Tax=Amniculicola lignicola CBS 123094 TaxID=1392246 RepID=A0A6A5WUM3_9PLEO|nr:P-loop containing nucleoside triphosphate hydrolase protein [Amniculicola lignicola CBS 123094]
MSRVCETDASFGPGIGSCRGGFDFTLLFEDSILSLLPQAIFLFLAPIRLATLRRRRDKVAKGSHLGFLKLTTSACYVVSSVAVLALWSEVETFKTRLSVASAALGFLGSLLIVILSRLEHTRAVRPSHLLQFFLLVLLLCEAVRLRTLFLMDYPPSLVTPASIHTCLTGFLLLLESLDKRELLYSEHDRSLSPEETIGLFGKRLFWYLNGLFREGYHKVLKPKDLFDVDADLASEERTVVFQKVWKSQDKSANAPLLRTILKVLGKDLCLPMIPRLLQIGTTISQPYLITAMIHFIQDRNNPDTKNIGFGLIGAFALNYSILAISSSWSNQGMARFVTKFRGCLITSIYEQTLQVTSKDVNLGSATVLMNVDVEKVMIGFQRIHEIWATVVSVSIALFILYSHLGGAFLAPLIATLVATGLCMWIGKLFKPRQLQWVAATQKRVTSITYVVGCMKGVRMLGLSETVLQMLTKLREAEVTASTQLRKLLVWILLFSNTMFQITTLVTYVSFAIITILSDGSSFDYNVLYGSLSALKLVTSPLMMVLQLIPTIQASFASLERIQLFLMGATLELHPHGDGSFMGNNPEDCELASVSPSTPQMRLSHATFAVEDEKPLLSDITLDLPPKSLTMLFGKVGSGKSVMLRSLVGETKLLSGGFHPPSAGVAFCEQSVWLRNTTIRDNIISEDEFNEGWYQSVLWSCILTQDLQEMKKGDLTPIGSQGISLSGGQKNRIALARALYSRRPILLCDDMLAGLDSRTEKMVFVRVFGPNGLLRKAGVTVLLATHATYFARHADKIIVLSDGRIVEDGTYSELVAKGVNLYKLDDTSTAGPEDDSFEDIDHENSIGNTVLAVEQPVDDGEDDEARRSGDRKSLWFFLSAVGRLHCSLYFGLMAASQLATTIQFLWLKWWAQSDNSDRSGTIRNLYLFVIITIVNILLFLVFIGHFALYFMPRTSLALHAKQLNALMRARFSNIVSTDIGNITNRFSQDIVLVDNQLQFSWINVTTLLLSVISTLGIVLAATPPIAAIIPFLGLAGYLIQRVYLRTSRQVRLMDLEAKAPLCTHFLESLAGIVTIRAFGWSSAYRKKNKRHLDDSQVPFYLLFAIQNWLGLVLELMVAGLVTFLVALAVGLRSKVDAGFLGLALVSAMDLGFEFRIIIQSWTELETSLSAVTRIRQFSQIPSEENSIAKSDPPGNWPSRGSVHLKSITASYTDNGKAVLNNIDLVIKPGEKIGLCGRTGSGKSSLVAALFGLLHLQEGQILIDDVSAADILLSDLRSKIISLPQEPFFLRGTVRHNLDPWVSEAKRATISDAQMRNALEQVQLWGKLSTTAGAGLSALDVSLDDVDSLLSQGERQLFCLARAILMDGKIVVLDEATSSVDAQTDALMQSILRTAFADRTIIAIAHRLDTILDFDRIIVMDAGNIAEIGEPSVLVEIEGSLFRGLVESQRNK